MRISPNYILNYTSYIGNQLIQQLSPIQKRIALIALFCLSLITLSYLTYRCFYKKVTDETDETENVKSTLDEHEKWVIETQKEVENRDNKETHIPISQDIINGDSILPEEVYKHIFSFLPSVQDLGRLSLVSKSFGNIANQDDLWEKLCQQEDPEVCKTKIQDQNWKNFYKEAFDLVAYQKEGKYYYIRHTYNSLATRICINLDKAKMTHLKRLIHKECPILPLEGMQIYLNGKELEDNQSLKDHADEMLRAPFIWVEPKTSVATT